MLGMFQMSDEGGTHLDEQCLELAVLDIGNQSVVERVKDCLVIGDFMIDVGPIEGAPLEFLQSRQIVIASFAQAFAGRVALRCYAQLGNTGWPKLSEWSSAWGIPLDVTA